MVCFYKGQIPPNAPGGGLTTFDRLLSPNQGRFALIKVKSPTSPQGGGGGGGGGGSRNNDRRITANQVAQCRCRGACRTNHYEDAIKGKYIGLSIFLSTLYAKSVVCLE